MSTCVVCFQLATKDNLIIKCHVPACKKTFHQLCSHVASINDTDFHYCKSHYQWYLDNQLSTNRRESSRNQFEADQNRELGAKASRGSFANRRSKESLNVENDDSNKTEVDPPKESNITASTPQKSTNGHVNVNLNDDKTEGQGIGEFIRSQVSGFFKRSFENQEKSPDKTKFNDRQDYERSSDKEKNQRINFVNEKPRGSDKSQPKRHTQNDNFEPSENERINREYDERPDRQGNFNFHRAQNYAQEENNKRKSAQKDDDSEEENLKIYCHECNREIKREPYACRACFIQVHRVCIPSVQIWSISNSKRSFNCIECQKYLNEEQRKSRVKNREESAQLRDRLRKEQAYDNRHSSFESRPQNTSMSNNKYQFAFNGRMLPMSEQLFFTERKLYYKLPIVTDLDRSWRLFYTAYQQSKNYYDDSGNVLRISKAIQCKEVLEIGGDNLFETEFYDETIELINKRGHGTVDLAIKLRNKIESAEKPENDDDESIMKLLDLVQNFFKVIKRENMYNYLHDPNLCVEIILKMPRRTCNILSTRRREALDRGEPYYIGAMMPVLENLLADTKHKMEMIRMIEKNKVVKKKAERAYTTTKINNHESSDSDSSQELTHAIAPVRDKYACWFHPKSNNHTANKCSNLWKMSGEEVIRAAVKANRCLICGLPKHVTDVCPYAKGLKCNVKTCEEAHHALFCKKRPKKETRYVQHSIEEIDEDYLHECNAGDPDSEEEVIQNINTENEVIDEELLYFRINHSMAIELEEGRNNRTLLERDDDREKCVNNDGNNLSCKDSMNNDNKELSINVITTLTCAGSSQIDRTFSSSHQLPIVVSNIVTPKGLIKAAFLLDSGSTTSLIDKDFANKILAKGVKHSLSIKGINSRKSDEKSRIIKLPLTRMDDNTRITHIYFHTFEGLNISRQNFSPKEYYKRYKELKALDLREYDQIMGLIGIDNLKIFKWTTTRHKNDMPHSPIGIRTIIGDSIIACESPLEQVFEDEIENCLDKELFISKEVNQTTFRQHRVNMLRVTNAIEDLYVEKEIYHTNLNEHEIKLEDYEDEFNRWEELIFMQENDHFSLNETENYYKDRADKLLKTYVKRISDSNHFRAPILWKEENIKLPTEQSYRVALRRFLIIEKIGKKKEEFNEYEIEMRKLLEKGYASQLSLEEIQKVTPKTYYVPIFFIKPESKRLRFIWDFKSKCEGKSYNDYVLSGPNLYSKIENILLQSREKKYLVKGDIESMFHQVHLLEKDKDSMRFLFRFSDEEEIKIYRMNVLPFGAACSPILSLYVKNLIAEEIREVSPLACDTLINNTYVDDILKTLSSRKAAIRLVVELKQHLKRGGFNLLKLNGNSLKITEQLKREFSNEMHEKLFTNETEEKLLGYNFNFMDDSISVCFDIANLPTNTKKRLKTPTKRTVLQVANGFYDPLGLYGFITAKMKILYSRVCKSTKKWDEEIPSELLTLWDKCLQWYDEAKIIAIPRLSVLKKSEKIDLLAFSDAGKEMLCVVVFVRSTDSNSNALTKLIKSKTITVSNRRQYTIPELELDAAAHAVKLVTKLKTQIGLEITDTYFFTDSYIVLHQITGEKKNKLSIYAENRISTIKRLSSPVSWYWIPSQLQTADFGTKIESITRCAYSNEWFVPKILYYDETCWKKFQDEQDSTHSIVNNEETKIEDESININNYKSFYALANRSALILLMKYKFDTKYHKLKKEIIEIKDNKRISDREKRYTLKEKERKLSEIETYVSNHQHWYELAESHWLRHAQESDKEIKEVRDSLKSGKKLMKSNKFYSLLPFLDNDGLVRLQTRVNPNPETLTLIEYDKAQPILLPKTHGITELIVLDCHKKNAHCYLKTVISELKSRFFIKHMNSAIKNIIKRNCHYCIRYTTKLLKPIMGDVPRERFSVFEPPFSYIVIDAFGPIIVKPSRYSKTEIKRWVLLSICLSTRATHMEILQDASSESVLEALEITFAMRGTAKEIYSDLAPSFLAANKKMIDITNEWNFKLISQGIIRSHIKWNNKAAHSPWTQGAAERMIGETKKLMKNFHRMMLTSKTVMTDFQLRHILIKIMNILNNSPIAIIEENCSFTNLTPAHFLMMRENTQSHPWAELNCTDMNKHWHCTQNIIKTLWEEWLKSYFSQILHREKWCDYSEPLKVGDLIVTAEKGFCDSWRLGRVIKIDEGSNDQVRSVCVKLGKNKLIDIKSIKDYADWMKEYKKEGFVLVTRPARLIAKINLQEREFKAKVNKSPFLSWRKRSLQRVK